MALTAEALLEAVSDDQPCGEDLSYDSERSEIELAFESGASSDPDGGEVAEIDWRPVLKQIEAQFSRTKDIWLAVYLCRAGARSGALEVVEVGAQTLAGLFERYWDAVHPTIDELGIPGRKAPCDALARRAEFLGPLERAILISHPRLGSYSGADVERFRSGGDGEDGYGMFRAALDDLGAEALQQALERLKSIEDGFRRADRIFTANANGESPPNFSPTYEVLSRLQRGLTAFVPGADAAANDDGGGEDTGGAPSRGDAAAAGGRLSGKGRQPRGRHQGARRHHGILPPARAEQPGSDGARARQGVGHARFHGGVEGHRARRRGPGRARPSPETLRR
jgi:type VI secretion system protein ImpA